MTLLAFFELWTTTLAVAAGAVSVPVIIHLLNRRRFKVVTWAAMRFLLAAQKQNTRRMRLEQLILLLVRATLVLLIVLAMAAVMPWAEEIWASVWPEGSGVAVSRGGRAHHVIVLDGSLSMNQMRAGKSLFDHARQMALDKVKNAHPGDGFSVLLMKDNPVWIVGEPSHDARKVMREIEQLRASHGNASVPAVLNMVAAKVTEAAGRFPAQNVYFLTDMQRSTWLAVLPGESAREGQPNKEKLPYLEISQRAAAIFVDLGTDDAKNHAVTNLALGVPWVTTGMKVPINVTIQNFTKETRKNLRVELLVGRARELPGDQPFSLRPANPEPVPELQPGVQQRVTLYHAFTAPGTYALQVQLKADGDELEIDDARSIIVTVKDTIPVLLVNGKPAVDRYDRATEYLRLALNPFPKGTEPKFAPLRPKVLSAAQLVDTSEAELAGFDAIFLCDVPQFGAGELRRLEGHLRRGGGLVVSMGDRAADNLDVYNRLLFKNESGLLPAKLFKKIQAPADHHFLLQGQEEAFREPPLLAFSDADDRISLRSGRFRQYVQAKPAGDAKVRTILSFMPEIDPLATIPFDKTLAVDDPALLEWNPPLGKDQVLLPLAKDRARFPIAPARYRGKVILFTSTVNMDWNSWPGSPSFGALMQEVTHLAVSGRMREQANLVGQLLEEYLPAAGNELDAQVHLPDSVPGLKPQRTRTQLIEDVNAFRWADTDISGIYKVILGSDPREFLFAVNPPSTTPDQRGSESDLTRVDKDKMRENYPGWEIQVVTNLSQASLARGPVNDQVELTRAPMGPAIAHWLLVLALILILTEVVLAWKFGHYSAVEGTTAQAATGYGWPLAAAIVAGVVFLLGAYVLMHAARTGDFLGFLPDALRGWAERALDVPPAPPGENTRWDLERQSWLPAIADETWLAGAIALAAIFLIFFTYRAEAPNVHPANKVLLGFLRVFLVLVTISALLPQLQLRFDRQGWPDIVVLIDDSRSMGEPDFFQDEKVRDRAKQLAEPIKKKLQETLPARIKALETELTAKAKPAETNPDLRPEVEKLTTRLHSWQQQLAQVNSESWRPTRLQLAQALLAQPDQEWLRYLLHQRRSKVHIYHIDYQGRAVKLHDGDITDRGDPALLDRAHQAVANLEPEAMDSRLGTALRQVIDQYRGSALSSVIMITDGVTTREETIAQVGEYAAQKGVPLFFVGIGDDHEIRDLRLHDLQVEDTIYVGDTAVFEARLTGSGYKDLTVPIVLKLKQANGKEIVLAREKVKVDPAGKSKKVTFKHTPDKVGVKNFVVAVELPKLDRPDKGPNPANLRLERAVDVQDLKLLKVLYVEGQPRYEYRFIKSLLERENPDAKKNRSIELNVVLLDADADFPTTDKSALADFPATPTDLNQYDVVILGDADPRHAKLGTTRLKMLADFVRGDDAKGTKTNRTGGGLLIIAGPLYNPHAYKDTPLKEVMPIEPATDRPPPEPKDGRPRPFRPELTPIGRMHPLFRFVSDDAENQAILQRLAPMFWWSAAYRIKPLAEVLAVHPTEKAAGRDTNQDGRHPLVVQQFVGSGRSMFFGIDETWRWRFREDEIRFNKFWIQAVRYLSRTRITKTDLRLDRQTPYRMGEPIKVTVRFPESAPIPGTPKEPKTEVKVSVEFRPHTRKDEAPSAPETQTLALAKVEGSFGTFEGTLSRSREGKYRFRLTTPDVSKHQADGEKPSAEATVELPPGELDKLRMDQQGMTQAADATQGRFYNLAAVDQLPDDLPPGFRVSISNPQPPLLLWNHWLMFLLVLSLVTAEWLLRKRKHLL